MRQSLSLLLFFIGVRVLLACSTLDAASYTYEPKENADGFIATIERGSLKSDGREGLHLEEALILASKIASCKGIVAELCWSDDPSYVIGYVGTKDNYERIVSLF